MKLSRLLVFVIFVAACHKKNASTLKNAENLAETETKIEVSPKPVPVPFSKVLREAIYFSNSLEREALKLIIRDYSTQRLSLFSVLSFAVETISGAKKSTPIGLDCGKYEAKRSDKSIVVLKSCYKPGLEVARIDVLSEDREFEIRFFINNLAPVVGMSVVLTNSDIKCRLRMVDQKLNLLDCSDWSYQVNEDQMSSTVIKTKEFLFQRNAAKQFVIRGGFYKELIENKKIDIEVPLHGKIKIFEKELKVIDEFADQKNGVIDEKKQEEVKSDEKIKTESQGGQSEGQKSPGEESQGQGQSPESQGEKAVEAGQDQSSGSGETRSRGR